MTAPSMLQSLTRRWYAFTAFTAVFLFLRDGIGIIPSMVAAVVLACLPVVYLLGRRLLAKGRITFVLLLVVSALAALSGSIGIGRTILSFIDDGSPGLLADAAATAVWVYLHVRSFLVLTNEHVRAHFA